MTKILHIFEHFPHFKQNYAQNTAILIPNRCLRKSVITSSAEEFTHLSAGKTVK